MHSIETPLQIYLRTGRTAQATPGFLAYLSNLTAIAEVNPKIASSIVRELNDQRTNLKLIASENFSSLATQSAMGNLFTDKYAEGFPHSRFYAGCDNVDAIEDEACAQAKKLFGAEHVYVQPHSGADANLIAFWAILKARVESPALQELGEKNLSNLSRRDWDALRRKLGNQRLLAMDYYSGGHLTHGYRHNVSAQMFDAHSYTVDRDTGLLDYDAIENMAREVRPLILLAGYSAYPRAIDFRRMRTMADAVGAVLMVDMAHFAGLVAGGVFRGEYNPIPFAHIVTSTTHKTLRGPRGGVIFCQKEFSEYVDKGCPMVIGGPLPQMMAAKAVAFTEANDPAFRAYASQVQLNARRLAQACVDEGLAVSTGGTDNHLMLIDVTPFGLNGRLAESAVRACGITLNRNALPFDPNGPWYTSGLRVGTPAVTTLGMGDSEMVEIASILKLILAGTRPRLIVRGKNKGQPSRSRWTIEESARAEARSRLTRLLEDYPLYPELDLEFLREHFADPGSHPPDTPRAAANATVVAG